MVLVVSVASVTNMPTAAKPVGKPEVNDAAGFALEADVGNVGEKPNDEVGMMTSVPVVELDDSKGAGNEACGLVSEAVEEIGSSGVADRDEGEPERVTVTRDTGSLELGIEAVVTAFSEAEELGAPVDEVLGLETVIGNEDEPEESGV